MIRPVCLLTLFLLPSATLIPQTASTTSAVSAKALQIQNSTIVVDTHADTPQRFLDENFDIAMPIPKITDTSASTRRAPATWVPNFSPSGSNLL